MPPVAEVGHGAPRVQGLPRMSTSKEALVGFLQGTPFFGGLDDASLDRVAGMLVARTFAPGQVVYRQGDQGRSMYVVERGDLVMCATGCNREVKLVRLHQGDFFGDTSLVSPQLRPSTVRVETETVLHELTNVGLLRLYREDVKAYVLVLQNMNRELCRRLAKADARITEYAQDDDDETTQIGRMPRRPL